MEGIALLVGRTLTTDQNSTGIVIFKARSDEDARALMEADPAVSKGVMSATLFPSASLYRQEPMIRVNGFKPTLGDERALPR